MSTNRLGPVCAGPRRFVPLTPARPLRVAPPPARARITANAAPPPRAPEPPLESGLGRVFEGFARASEGLAHVAAGVTQIAHGAPAALGLPVPIPASPLDREAPPTLEEQRALRAWVRAVLIATEAPAGCRAEPLRSALRAHPIVLTWLLERRDLDLLWKSSDLPTLPDTSRVAQLAQLSRTLALFEDRRATESPWLRALMGRGGVCEAWSFAVDRLPGALLERVAEEVEAAYAGASLDGLNPLARLRDPDVGLRVANMPDSVREVVDRILARYVTELPSPTRRRIVLSLLELPPRAGLEVTLPAILEHLGPGLLKLFQLIGRNVESPVIEAVMRGLQDRVRPFDGEEARKEVSAALGRPMETVFSRFDAEPIAAATVGQVHLATLRETGEPVVVKVLRAGLRARIEEEFATLARLTEEPSTKRLLTELKGTVLAETDLRNEYAYARAARVYGDGPLLAAVRVFEAYPATERVLIQTRAEGRGIDRYDASTLAAIPITPHRFARLKLDALQRLLGAWFEHAMTGEGFFHADPHAGNVFLQVDAHRGRAKATLIDFGSSGFLSSATQKAMLDLLVAIVVGRVEHTVYALEAIAPPISEASRGAFNEEIRAILATDAHVVNKWKAVVLKALDFGLALPVELSLFQRGRLMIEDQITRAEQQLDLHDPDRRIPRTSIEDIYVRVLLRLLMRWDYGVRVHQKLQECLGRKSL